jgi:hypothetical protein
MSKRKIMKIDKLLRKLRKYNRCLTCAIIFPVAVTALINLVPARVCRAAGEGNINAVLADPVMEETIPGVGPVEFKTGQVNLLFPDGTSKLLPYRSHLIPRIIDNRQVYIFPSSGGELEGKAVIYDVGTGEIKTLDLPADIDRYFACPEFSPGGNRIAYYVVVDNKAALGRVRVKSWPEGKLLSESPVCGLRATDVPPSAPVWKESKRVSFDPEFFDPPHDITLEVE